MPALKQALRKYRKHKASGQAVVTLSGRDHYLGTYGTRVSRLQHDRLKERAATRDRRKEDRA